MAEETAIEWADATWSPVTGCTDADESCRWCYAKRLTATRLSRQTRYQGLAKVGRNGPQWSGQVRLHPEILRQPLGWTKTQRRIFVCSMSDLFHRDVPEAFIARVWAAMWLSHAVRGHQHLVLTKRSQRAFELVSSSRFRDDVYREVAYLRDDMPIPERRVVLEWPFLGIHLGLSAGRQEEAVERWSWLRRTPAQARFMSLEPLIGSVNLAEVLSEGFYEEVAGDRDAAKVDRHAVAPDLVIAGGESGTRQRCRAPHPDWFRDLRDACQAIGVPFFFKQWGNFKPIAPLYGGGATDEALDAWEGPQPEVVAPSGVWNGWRDGGQPPTGAWLMGYTSKKDAGRLLDGRTHDGQFESTA